MIAFPQILLKQLITDTNQDLYYKMFDEPLHIIEKKRENKCPAIERMAK